MLPVSLQVLEAGEGGGGISNLSAFSLFEELFVVKLAKKQFSITILYLGYTRINMKSQKK